MLRTVLIQAAIFAAPFLVYALYLLATKKPLDARESWTAQAIVWCGVVALLLTFVSLVGLARFSGAPPTATYEPPHVEDGRVVPGRFR